jgi:hypothetical protein
MTTHRAIGGTGILIKALVSLTISRIGDKCRWGKNTRVHDLFQFDCVNSDCTGDADSHADLIGLQLPESHSIDADIARQAWFCEK